VASDPEDLIYGFTYVTYVIALDANGAQHPKRATLDSGSEVSIVASDVVEGLGITVRQPSAGEAAIQLLFPREEPVEPLGQAEVEWYFQNSQGEPKVYKSVFWVLDSEEFDILVGAPLIDEHKLFKPKRSIWSRMH
jgi:hypothetical protein